MQHHHLRQRDLVAVRTGVNLIKLFFRLVCGLYYKHVTIVIDAPSVIKVTLQIVASLTIVTRL